MQIDWNGKQFSAKRRGGNDDTRCSMMAQTVAQPSSHFPYSIMRTGCVAKAQTHCPLSKTIPNVALYSSKIHCGHLGWPRSISLTWKTSSNPSFSMAQLMDWIEAYMLNKLRLKMLLIIFVHFWFASSWQLALLPLCAPGEGGLQAQWQSQQASDHGSPMQHSFRSRCSTIMEQTHYSTACFLSPGLDTTEPQRTAYYK